MHGAHKCCQVQAWQLATEEGPVCRAQAATALARMRHRYLAPAWVSWQQRRAAAARKRSLLATAVLRLQQRSMRAAWAAWQVTIRGYLIILTSLATLLCCWHLVYWISGWDQPVRGQHEGRRHIFAGCRGAQAQPAGCRRIFNSQAVELEPGSRLVRVEGACASKQQRRQQLAQAVAWFRSGSLTAAFVAWRDTAQDQQQAASRMLEAVTFFQSHRQLAAWNTWLEVRLTALLGKLPPDIQCQGRGSWRNSHA